MRKKLLGILYILVTLGITVYICLYTADFSSLKQAVHNIKWGWMAGGLGCMLLYFFFEALAPILVFRNQGYKLSVPKAIKVSMIGLYYSGITPSATGGQPMQVYYYSKMNLPIGLSSFISVLKFICFQSVMTTFCFFGLLLRFDYIQKTFPGAVIFAYIGMGINVALLIGVVILMYKPAILHTFLNVLMKLLAKFNGRRAVKLRKKGREEIENFYASFHYSKKVSKDFFAVLICSFLQIIAYLSVSYFIYKAFSLHGESFLQIFILQTLVVCAVSFFPMPGSAGAQELGYHSFFLPVFGDTVIFPAMILWRILSAYLAILIGAAYVTVDAVKGIVPGNKGEENSSEEK